MAPLTAETVLVAAVEHYLDRQAQRLASGAAAISCRDPEAVHDQRGAARRLTSVLRCLGPLLREKRSEALLAELDWFTTTLGRARDAEVVRDQVAVLVEQLEVEHAEALITHATTDADTQLRHVGRLYRSRRYRALVDQLGHLGAHLWKRRLTVDDPAVARRLEWTAQRARAAQAQAFPAPDAQVGELHRLRRRLKDMRYAAQAAAEADPTGAATQAFGDIGTATAVLGQVQDAVIVRTWLGSVGCGDVAVPVAVLAAVDRAGRDAVEQVDEAVAGAMAAWNTWAEAWRPATGRWASLP